MATPPSFNRFHGYSVPLYGVFRLEGKPVTICVFFFVSGSGSCTNWVAEEVGDILESKPGLSESDEASATYHGTAPSQGCRESLNIDAATWSQCCGAMDIEIFAATGVTFRNY